MDIIISYHCQHWVARTDVDKFNWRDVSLETIGDEAPIVSRVRGYGLKSCQHLPYSALESVCWQPLRLDKPVVHAFGVGGILAGEAITAIDHISDSLEITPSFVARVGQYWGEKIRFGQVLPLKAMDKVCPV